MTLFSQQHIEFQKKVHQECPAYGKASLVFAPMVSELINANQVKKLLDYGSGLGEVPQNLEIDHQIDVQLYDPAIEKFSASPASAEMVICLDVLDTVEQDHIDSVLNDLQRLTEKMAFFSINTKAAETGSDEQSLSRDNDRHYYPVEWWLPKLMERFELHYFSRINSGFVVVLRAFTKPSVQ